MFFYFQLWRPFYSSKRNRFSYFGRGSPEQHSYEVRLKSAQGYRRSWRLIFFSIFSSGGHLVYQSETFLAILVGNNLGNMHVKFESHWPKGLGGNSI